MKYYVGLYGHTYKFYAPDDRWASKEDVERDLPIVIENLRLKANVNWPINMWYVGCDDEEELALQKVDEIINNENPKRSSGVSNEASE